MSLCLQFMFVDLTFSTGLMVYCPLRCTSCFVISQYLWRPVVSSACCFDGLHYTYSCTWPCSLGLCIAYLALCTIVSMSWAGLFFFLQCFCLLDGCQFFVVLKKRHRWYPIPASMRHAANYSRWNEYQSFSSFQICCSGSVHSRLQRNIRQTMPTLWYWVPCWHGIL